MSMTKCSNHICPLHKTCARYTYKQAGIFVYTLNGDNAECSYYIPNIVCTKIQDNIVSMRQVLDELKGKMIRHRRLILNGEKLEVLLDSFKELEEMI